MVTGNLLAERLLDVVARRRRRQCEQFVIRLGWHGDQQRLEMLFLEFRDVCGRQLATRPCRQLTLPQALANVLCLRRSRAVGTEVPARLQRAPAVRAAAALTFSAMRTRNVVD